MSTLKQKKAIENVIENHGNISKAMKDAGYTLASAKNPSNLTHSKAWKELVEDALPNEKLFKVHIEALQANKVVSARVIGKDADSGTDDFIEVPDQPVRVKALELAYKIKGKLNTDSGVNIEKANILVMPEELIKKYEISSNTSGSSK